MRTLKLTFALVVVALGLSWAPRAHAGLSVYHLYVIWLQGEGEGNQKDLDAFVDCLFHHSSYETYWGSSVLIDEASYVVPKPTAALGDASQIGPFIDGLIAAKKISAPPSYGTPIYQVMVDPYQTSCSLGNGTGGRNAPGTVQGKPAGLIINTTNTKAFWPARIPAAAETQLTEHEVAEVIDGLRGGDRCCGDFCCEGWCNNTSSCGNFSGLECPGAPATTFTGSSACGDVKGWLVQTLAHGGATTCYGSPTCDFSLGKACATNSDNMHAPCGVDADCCAGLSCQKWTYSGHADDPPKDVCCKAIGATCASGTDCCGGMNCDNTNHVCTCATAAQFCANDTDCCDGLSCQNAACATKPPPPPADAGSEAAPPAREAGADAGADGGDGEPPPGEGCSCRESSSKPPAGAFLLALVVLGSLRRRRSAV